jgi:hypothetical protein
VEVVVPFERLAEAKQVIEDMRSGKLELPDQNEEGENEK